MTEEQIEKSGCVCSLYRYDKVTHNKQWFMHESADDVLSAHEVGTMFGSGEYRYLLVPNDKSKKVRAWRFNVGAHYDQIRDKSGRSDDGQDGTGGRHMGLGDSLSVIREVAELVKSMMVAQRDSQPPAAPSPDMGFFSESLRLMSSAMQQQMTDNLKFVREISMEARRGALALPSPEEEQGGDDVQSGTDTIIDKLERVWPMIEPFVKKLVGGGPDAEGIAAMIKGNPEMQGIINDARRFSQFVKIMDAKLGKAKVDEALGKIGVVRP